LITRLLRNSDIVRGVSALVLILTLFANALVPTGWMPSFGANGGKATLVICAPGNVDFPGPGDQEDDERNGAPSDFKHKGAQVCPFGTLTLIGNDEPLLVPLPKSALSFENSMPVAFALPDAKNGSPLGSRAPPQGA
jgi:hypothetical protein